MEFSLPLEAKPTPRPRVSRFGGVYYPRPYQEYKKTLEEWFDNQQLVYLSSPLAVEVTCHIPKPAKTRRKWPGGDVDNLAKGVLDAMSGRVWADDDQVQSLTTKKEWADSPMIWVSVKEENAYQV